MATLPSDATPVERKHVADSIWQFYQSRKRKGSSVTQWLDQTIRIKVPRGEQNVCVTLLCLQFLPPPLSITTITATESCDTASSAVKIRICHLSSLPSSLYTSYWIHSNLPCGYLEVSRLYFGGENRREDQKIKYVNSTDNDKSANRVMFLLNRHLVYTYRTLWPNF